MNFENGVDGFLQSGLLPIYYSIVAICALFVLIKFQFKPIAVFSVLLFWEGLFSYFAVSYPVISGIYKIGFVIIAILLFGKTLSRRKTAKEKTINFLFFSLGITILISGYLNNNDFLTMGSQFLKKYSIPFLFYYGLKRKVKTEKNPGWVMNLLTWILGFQILFGLLKLVLFGFGESLVGSVSFNGGAPSNIIPVLGFLVIWVKSNGTMRRNDWIFVFGLLVLATIGNKRSVVIILPLVIAATMVYVKKSTTLFSLIKYLPVAVTILIMGVITNPSLNPEQSRLGSFDINYLSEYVVDYTFGKKQSNSEEEVEQGRGGSFISIITVTSLKLSTKEYLFGRGMEAVFTKDYESFDASYYGVLSKGSTGAAIQNFISFGLIGMILTWLFGISIIRTLNNKNLKWILFVFVTWDYILFYNSTIIINSMSLLLVTIILFFNQYENLILSKPIKIRF